MDLCLSSSYLSFHNFQSYNLILSQAWSFVIESQKLRMGDCRASLSVWSSLGRGYGQGITHPTLRCFRGKLQAFGNLLFRKDHSSSKGIVLHKCQGDTLSVCQAFLVGSPWTLISELTGPWDRQKFSLLSISAIPMRMGKCFAGKSGKNISSSFPISSFELLAPGVLADLVAL